MRPAPRYAAGLAAAAAVVVAVVIVWLRPADLGTSLAYADVQEAVRQVQTVILDEHYPQCPHQDQRVLISRQTPCVRTEWSNGYVMIIDGKAGKSLALNPQSKTAVLMPGPSGAPAWDELFDELVNIEQRAAKKLGEQTFDGRKLVGFELKPAKHQRADITARVWVDPQTRLPVRCEAVSLSPGDPRTASLHQITTFTFNRPLDESLFAMTPPEGYTLSETAPLERPSPPPPEHSSLASPVIKPGVGIGDARFGMNVEEVIKALGKPERIQKYWHSTPEQNRVVEEAFKKAREENLDRFERQGLLDEADKKFDTTKRKPDGVGLLYSDRGFRLSVANDGGFKGIQCYAHHPGMQPFTGKTAEGIGIGATAEEIENTYGPPDAKSDVAPGVFLIHYLDLGLSFQGDKGRLWLIMARAPDK